MSEKEEYLIGRTDGPTEAAIEAEYLRRAAPAMLEYLAMIKQEAAHPDAELKRIELWASAAISQAQAPTCTGCLKSCLDPYAGRCQSCWDLIAASARERK